MYIDNNWYGHRFILSKYSQIEDKPSFASIQHGWYKIPNLKQSKIKFAPFLCWNKRTADLCLEKKIINSVIIGSPFLYLDKIISKKTVKNSGTIFFPSHSVPKSDRHPDALKTSDNYNQNEIINSIEKISEAPHTVCLYYTDYNQRNIDMFKKKNWRVLTLGDRTNKERLFHLHKELSSAKNVISTDVNTTIFYALYLKKNVKVIYDKESKIINTNYDNEYAVGKKLFFEKYPELFNSFLGGEKGLNLAKEELGYNFIKDKDEIVYLLGRNSFYKMIASKLIFYLMKIKYSLR